MRRFTPALIAAALVVACANSEVVQDVPDTGTVPDASTIKDSGKDVEVKKDSGTKDASGSDATLADASGDATLDATADATVDATSDASDASSVDASDGGVDASDAAVDANDGGIVVLDGGTSNDTCQMAVALTSGVPVSGDTTSATDNYDVNVNLSNVCSLTDLSFYQFDGNDVAYTISVPNGKTLTVTVTPTTSWDPALALVSDCSNIGPTCLGGDDFNGSGDPEVGTHTNNSGQTETIYIVVDSYTSSEYGPFTLSAVVQ